MPPARVDTDAFTAIAEPKRRRLLRALETGERSVTELVAEMRLAQPQVSKHLRVLRQAGLVEVRSVHRRRMYRLDARPLRQVFDWVAHYETFWQLHLDQVKRKAEEMARTGNLQQKGKEQP